MHSRFPRTPGCRLALAAAAVLLVCLGSCARKATVTGSVSLDGKLLPAGYITFIGSDGRASDPGTIENGHYMVSNAPVGECKIRVDTSSLNMQLPGMMPNMPGMAGGKGDAGIAFSKMNADKQGGMMKNADAMEVQKKMAEMYVEIPPDYADPAKTPLKFTVKSGTNAFDVELVSPPGWKSHAPPK